MDGYHENRTIISRLHYIDNSLNRNNIVLTTSAIDGRETSENIASFIKDAATEWLIEDTTFLSVFWP